MLYQAAVSGGSDAIQILMRISIVIDIDAWLLFALGIVQLQHVKHTNLNVS